MAKKTTPEWLKELDGKTEITLTRPVDIMGTKVSVLCMREPTVADNEATSSMEGSDATREIHEFANLCDMSPDEFRKLSLKDYQRVRAAYLAFIV